MAIQVGVYCDSTRLPSLDAEDGSSLGFNLLLSATGLGEPADEELAELKEKLRLWESTGDTLRVWNYRKGAWEPVEAGSVEVLPWPDGNGSEVRTWAASQIEERAKDELWQESLQGDTEPKGVEADADRTCVHVRHLLAHLATQPAPVPQHLRLSWLVRVRQDALADGTAVVVVPALGPFEPEIDSAGGASSDPVALHYGEEPFPFSALAASAETAPTTSEWIQPSGWVHSEGLSWADDDFVRLVERRFPEYLDHARQLMGVVQAALASRQEGSEPSTLEESLKEISGPLRRALMAVLHDRVNVGLKTSVAAGDEDLGTLAGLGAGPREQLLGWQDGLGEEVWLELLRGTLEAGPLLRLLDPPTEPPPPELPLTEIVREVSVLLTALSEVETVETLVRQQWDRAGLTLDELARLDEALARPGFDLPALLASVARDGLALSGLVRALPAESEIAPALAHLVAFADHPISRCRQRWIYLPPGLRREGDEEELTAVLEAVGERVENAVLELASECGAHGADPEIGPASPTPRPHAIAVPVLPEAVLVDGDPFERYQGFGLLMRRVDPDGPWRCLDVARLDHGGTQPLDAAAVVPVRLGYEKGLRQTHLTYDNQPLAARSPARDLTQRGLAEGPEAEGLPDLEAFLSRDPVDLLDTAETRREWARLPGLAFGQTYEVAAFAVTNGGVLPVEIRTDGRPWRLTDFDSGTETPVPGQARRRLRYLRRVPFGAPRLLSDGEGKRIQRIDDLLPPIPQDVAPRGGELTELERECLAPPKCTSIDGVPAGPSSPPGPPPLALLLPEDPNASEIWRSPDRFSRTSLSFYLGQPAVDLMTWDRCMALESSNAGARKAAWRNHFEAVEEGRDAPVLEDPAASGRFLVTWRNVRTGEQGDSAWIEGTKLQIRLADGVAEAVGDARFELGDLEAGGIYLLRVQAAFDEEARLRFHPRLPCGLHGQHGGSYLGPPFDLLVEVARKPRWAGVEESYRSPLFAALVVAAEGCDQPASLSVTLSPTAPQEVEDAIEDSSSYVVRRQAWRWDGREHDPFPFSEGSGAELLDSPRYLDWLATVFAERPDSDAVSLRGTISHLDDLATKRLLELPRQGDDRAVLFRVGLSLRSRYAGLLRQPAHRELEAKREVADARERSTSQSTVLTPWRPFFDAARRRETLPQPRLKLVVPLTEGDEGQMGTAPLLAVLDEPWHEVGGLAEELQVEVDRAAVWEPFRGQPDPNPNPLFELPEFGPDPIWTGDSWRSTRAGSDPAPEITPLAPGENRHVSFVARGPLGYTFDTDSTAPLFRRSAFVLERPSVPAWAAEEDLSWHFAKVRFRRRLDPEGREGYDKDHPATSQALPAGTQMRHFEGQLVPEVGIAHRLAFECVKPAGAGQLVLLGNVKEGDAVRTLDFLGVGVTASGEISVFGRLLGDAAVPVDGSLFEEGDAFTLDLALELGRRDIDTVKIRMVARNSRQRRWVELVAATLRLPGVSELAMEARALDGQLGYRMRRPPIRLLESEATAPTWAQLLPSSGSWEITEQNESTLHLYDVGELSIGCDALDVRTLRLYRREGQVLHDVQGIRAVGSPPAGEPGHLESVCYVLITRLISDARGREDEAFLALEPFEDARCTLTQGAERLRARLVEVHRVVPSNGAQDGIFDQLFPLAGNEDARARIVRVSAPIEVAGPPID